MSIEDKIKAAATRLELGAEKIEAVIHAALDHLIGVKDEELAQAKADVETVITEAEKAKAAADTVVDAADAAAKTL